MDRNKLNLVVERGVEYAFAVTAVRYEENADPEKNMAFHKRIHVHDVMRRTEMLAQAIGLSEDDTLCACLAGAFHDVVQDWYPAEDNGIRVRKHYAVRNKAASAAELIRWLAVYGKDVPTSNQDQMVEAIIATILGWDSKHNTVFQPNLIAYSSPVARCVALADLAADGMDGAAAMKGRYWLFMEEQLDIARYIRDCRTPADFTDRQENAFRWRLMKFLEGEVPFIRGREARLQMELGNLSPMAKVYVQALFFKFNEAVQALKCALDQVHRRSFWESAEDMGYNMPQCERDQGAV